MTQSAFLHPPTLPSLPTSSCTQSCPSPSPSDNRGLQPFIRLRLDKPNTQFEPLLLRSESIESPHCSHFSKAAETQSGRALLKSKYCRLILTSNQQSDGRDYLSSKAAQHKRKDREKTRNARFHVCLYREARAFISLLRCKMSKRCTFCSLVKLESSTASFGFLLFQN